jgi:hypothetical protein
VIKIYAVVLIVGMVALLVWVFLTVLAGSIDRPSLDLESRFGVVGRRAVAAAVGFGMAGMSAEYSPLDIGWPVAVVLALAGGGAAAWYAGKVGGEAEASV